MTGVADQLAAERGPAEKPRRGLAEWRRLRPDGVRLPPQRLAVALLAVVTIGYAVFAVVGVVFSGLDLVLSTALCAAIVVGVALQWLISRPRARLRPLAACLVLSAQAVLLLGPILVVGPVEHGLPGFVAGSALLVLPLGAGIPVAVLVVLAVSLLGNINAPIASELGSAFATTYVVTATITAAIAIFGLTSLVRLLLEAHDTQERLSAAAVADVRMRFTRRVHDLLGRRLSRIRLQGEMVGLLVSRSDPAKDELTALVGQAREALAEVRSAGRLRDEPPDEGPPIADGTSGIAPRLAAVMLIVVAGDFGVVAVGGIIDSTDLARGLVALPLILAAAALTLTLMLVRGLSRSAIAVMIIALAGLVYLPMVWLGPLWHGLPAFLGAVVLIALPQRPGLGAFVLVWASAVLVEYLDPAPASSLSYELAYTAVGFLVATLVLYGLGFVPRLLAGLAEARDDLGRLAIAREQMRLSRNLHDLLGLSLSTLTLKCELSLRLLPSQPEAAHRELVDGLSAARTAIAEVERVAEEDEPLSLSEECDRVRRTLESVRIEVEIDLASAPASEPLDTTFAIIAREAATNVLRHSDATRCHLRVREEGGSMVLEIVNDGAGAEAVPVPAAAAGPAVGGNGLPNMAGRVASLGGRLRAERRGDQYHLTASVPVPS